jgi:hypothetical protein
MANEMDFVAIVNALKPKQKKESNFIYGTIETLHPLSVRLDNEIVLPESFLFLGKACRPHRITLPHIHASAGREDPESLTINISPPLREGDRVLIFVFNNEQKFYIAERIE